MASGDELSMILYPQWDDTCCTSIGSTRGIPIMYSRRLRISGKVCGIYILSSAERNNNSFFGKHMSVRELEFEDNTFRVRKSLQACPCPDMAQRQLPPPLSFALKSSDAFRSMIRKARKMATQSWKSVTPKVTDVAFSPKASVHHVQENFVIQMKGMVCLVSSFMIC